MSYRLQLFHRPLRPFLWITTTYRSVKLGDDEVRGCRYGCLWIQTSEVDGMERRVWAWRGERRYCEACHSDEKSRKPRCDMSSSSFCLRRQRLVLRTGWTFPITCLLTIASFDACVRNIPLLPSRSKGAKIAVRKTTTMRGSEFPIAMAIERSFVQSL